MLLPSRKIWTQVLWATTQIKQGNGSHESHVQARKHKCDDQLIIKCCFHKFRIEGSWNQSNYEFEMLVWRCTNLPTAKAKPEYVNAKAVQATGFKECQKFCQAQNQIPIISSQHIHRLPIFFGRLQGPRPHYSNWVGCWRYANPNDQTANHKTSSSQMSCWVGKPTHWKRNVSRPHSILNFQNILQVMEHCASTIFVGPRCCQRLILQNGAQYSAFTILDGTGQNVPRFKGRLIHVVSQNLLGKLLLESW